MSVPINRNVSLFLWLNIAFTIKTNNLQFNLSWMNKRNYLIFWSFYYWEWKTKRTEPKKQFKGTPLHAVGNFSFLFNLFFVISIVNGMLQSVREWNISLFEKIPINNFDNNHIYICIWCKRNSAEKERKISLPLSVTRVVDSIVYEKFPVSKIYCSSSVAVT